MAFFGNKNPADAAMPYLEQISGSASPYLQPYFNAGQNALPNLQTQYNQLLNNPGNRLNEIGQSFHQSPGFQFALDKAMQAANHAASAGGMAGSPQHQEQSMELATQLGNQDYNDWLQHALGLYGGGLSGEQGLAGMGQQAGQSMADLISQQLAQQGNLAYQGQAQKNQNKNDMINNLLRGAGGVLGAFNPFSSLGSLAGPMSGSSFMPWNNPG